jgi:cytochrome c556
MSKVRPGSILRRGRRGAIAVIVGALGVSVAAAVMLAQEERPYPIYTPDHFVAAMKTAGQAYALVNSSVAKNDVDEAKAFLAISRDRLATTITYWRDRKRDDAVRMLRTVLTKMDELDAALSADALDRAAVGAIGKQVESGCASCHLTYREQDPVTKAFRIGARE